MKLVTKSTVFAIAIFSTTMGQVGSVGAEGVLESCSTDIVKFCNKVSPGNGRVISCLYAHEDSLSDACDAATDDLGDLLDGFFADIRDAYDQCAPDIEKHCSDVKVGRGRLVSCLASNQTSLAAECGEIVAKLKPNLVE